MELNVYFEKHGWDRWCYIAVFHGIYNRIVESNPDIKFNFIDNCMARRPGDHGNCKFGPLFMIIENPNNKKYIVISYWDKIKDIIKHYNVTNWDPENCLEIITSSGVHDSGHHFNYLDCKYTPGSYLCTTVVGEKYIATLDENRSKVCPDKLHFRGYIYDYRHYLTKDSRFVIIEKNNNFLDTKDYIDELSRDTINFSINGAGEICNRDIEILGIGNALFRTKLNCKFHNPLIPNYHYIAIEHHDLPQDLSMLHTYYKELSDRHIDRFEEVKKDKDFVEFVSDNGKRWYNSNGTVLANIDIMYNLLDLKKLT